MLNLTVIILTKDEKIHIQRCLEQLQYLGPKQVFVIDCLSTDGTQEIARALGATVIEHEWPETQSAQFNWALKNCPIQSQWVLRLDADEYLTPGLIEELKEKLPTFPEEVTGGIFPCQRVWMGRVIHYGTGRIELLRLFRFGKAQCEERLMDEHIRLDEGRAVLFQNAFADDNLNDLSWWTKKHIGYAMREAIDLLDAEYGLIEREKAELTGQAAEKRAKKLKYAKLPLFWRSFAYFCLRYFVKGGFLEGKEGFLWHFLQGWWYRTLVDAKVLEFKKNAGGSKRMKKEEAKKRLIEYLQKQGSFKFGSSGICVGGK